MKTFTLYLKLISLRVLQFIKKVSILLLAVQCVYIAGHAFYNFAEHQIVPDIFSILSVAGYMIGIIIMRSCKAIFVASIQEAHGAIEHNQKLNLRKKDLIQQNEYKMLEKQVEVEFQETADEMANRRKFSVEKVGSDATAELNKLVGLASVKEELQRMHAVTQYESKHGGIKNKTVYHMRFVGNPGCGKTTVAKCMASILYNAKIIKKPKLVSVNGNELMGEYLGQTAPTVRALFKQAAGGLLFIDEAYALTSGSHATSYGHEAVNELLTQLEDKRNDVVVIFAGYEEPLNQFFSMNPGLASRVPKTLRFPDYNPDEMMEILIKNLHEYGHKLDEKARTMLREVFESKINRCTMFRTTFSNGRYARNVADALHAEHALNYAKSQGIGSTISLQDVNYLALLDLN